MEEVPDQPSHAQNILSMIEQRLSEGKYWDVQLRVGTKVFKCLRALLATNSEYFDTMFSSNFEESNAADQPITLHDMDASAFEELLHFMYTGDICVEDSNVLPLLFMNDFLRLRSGHVKEQCLVHVRSRSQENKPISNALDLLCFAHLKGEKVFVDILNAHISCHLYHYSKDVQLMEISFENLSALLEFSKDSIVPFRGSADVLLKIVHTWINHNREGRSQFRNKLMKNINVANISSDYTVSLVRTLENAVDEIVISLSKDIESLSELKMLVMGIATNLPESDYQFDGIISFNFKNVSKMQLDNSTVYSSPCIISGLSWKIGIGRRNDKFCMFLHCYGTDLMSVWNCYATGTFTIVSHKEGRDDFVRRMGFSLFTSNKKRYGYGPPSCMKWNDLMDSANGYLKDDDSINLNVRVYADVPFLKTI